MRIFQSKWFSKFARKERIGVGELREAVVRAGRGSIDADLGGSLVKQRISRQGAGRRGGYRTIIAVKFGDRAVYLYGFRNNDRDNISMRDLERLQEAAVEYLRLSDAQLEAAVATKRLEEIGNEQNS